MRYRRFCPIMSMWQINGGDVVTDPRTQFGVPLAPGFNPGLIVGALSANSTTPGCAPLSRPLQKGDAGLPLAALGGKPVPKA